MDYTIFQQLGVALALASLIGLEREHRYQVDDYDDFGGIRTFALIGLTGALAFILSAYYAPFFAVVTAGFLALLIAAYIITSRRKYAGGTSEIASILVYIIGILCGMEQYLVATTIALTVLLILHFKDPLHMWAKHIQNKEIASTIQFIIIAFIVLPLLPNEAYGPYGFFNPYVVWLMVVFISGISFLSYIAMRLFGAKKGITLTGFLSGLISSTALAFTFSAQSKQNKGIQNPYVLAIVIAGSAMFFRILIEVLVLNSALLPMLLVPMLSMGVTGILIAWFLWRKKEKIPENIERDVQKVKSPFSLGPALKFGIFFAATLFFSKFAMDYWGDRGVYFASVISGAIDVDAITVSMANLSKDGLSSFTATIAITIAAIVNTLFKALIFLFFGNRKVALKILLAFGLIIIVGGASFFFI